MADTNQDGQLSPYELNAAAGQVAKSAVQTVFQDADTDSNGSLSQAEYDKALTEPAHAVFRILDANNDNQLSYDEIQRTESIILDQIQRLRVPDQPNSILNRLEHSANTNVSRGATFASPSQRAPVAPAPLNSVPVQGPAPTPPAPQH